MLSTEIKTVTEQIQQLDLKTFREQHPKISYSQIAIRLGVDVNTVKSWGCGRRNQTQRTKRELAKLHYELISQKQSSISGRSQRSQNG